MIVLLDTGVLGLVTNPRGSLAATECANWVRDCLAGGLDLAIPEIADYELRRELIRAGLDAALGRLDALKNVLRYLPIGTPTMLQAASYWAQARNMGRPTADDRALDGDMILSAQAALAKTIDRMSSSLPTTSGISTCLPTHACGGLCPRSRGMRASLGFSIGKSAI